MSYNFIHYPKARTTVLKWLGNKSKHIPDLDRYFIQVLLSKEDKYDYYEPFLGSGAVFFYLYKYKREYINKFYINDSNTKLIIFYQCIRDHLDEVLHFIEKFYAIHNECEQEGRKVFYYLMRDSYNNECSIDKPDTHIYMSALLFILNKVGFRGLYRVNNKGHYNVPYGHYKTDMKIPTKLFRDMSQCLNDPDVVLSNKHFKDWSSDMNIQSKSLIYLDPPYIETFSNYTDKGFNQKDHIDLKDWLLDLHKTDLVKFIESNSNNEETRKLYSDNIFNIKTIYVERHIAKGKKPINMMEMNEVLITNIGENVSEQEYSIMLENSRLKHPDKPIL